MAEKENTILQALMEFIHAQPVIDTHEHLMPEAMRLQSKTDFFTITMSHYASSDLRSAGLPANDMALLRNADTPFEQKVRLFMPFWEKAFNTGYCRALSIAARDLYGIDKIDADSLPELNHRMTEANKPGLYRHILEEKCQIRYCLWDQFWVSQPIADPFFKLSLRLDDVVFVNTADDIRKLEEKYHLSITSLESLESILEIGITSHKSRGLTALKTGLAYRRTLDYEMVSKAEAALSLERLLRGHFNAQDVKVVQDYLMNSLAEKAFWHNITLQVHTGLLEGNGNYITHANPALLSALIINHPQTRFDLFHGGYPYGGELSAMAKMFPNVYLDMAWLHIISPTYTRQYLAEWLDTVPMNKIMGFGGDYIFAEGVYGHLHIAKENIGHVLADKVTDGIFTLPQAKRCAAMMLYENPDYLFGAM